MVYYATTGTIALVHGAWRDSIVDREEEHTLPVFSGRDAKIDWREGKDGCHDYNSNRGNSARLLLREGIARG